MSQLAVGDVAVITALLLECGEVDVAQRFVAFVASREVPEAVISRTRPRTGAERAKVCRDRKRLALEAAGQLRLEPPTLHGVTDRNETSRASVTDRYGHDDCSSDLLTDHRNTNSKSDRARVTRDVTHAPEHPPDWAFDASTLRPDLSEHELRAAWWKFATLNPSHPSERRAKAHFARFLLGEKPRRLTPEPAIVQAVVSGDDGPPVRQREGASAPPSPSGLEPETATPAANRHMARRPEIEAASEAEVAELRAMLAHMGSAQRFRQAGPIEALDLVDEALAPPSRAPAVA